MNPTRNLFCLPHAGGSSAVFQPWRTLSPPGLRVLPLALPGRGSQWQEPLLCEWQPLLEKLLAQITAHGDVPFVLFGHSMGALLAFELTHCLREAGWRAPDLLVLSASRGPQRRHRLAQTDWLQCSDAHLLAELEAISGPSEALANAELRELMLPIVRNDFQLCARYACQPRAPLQVPLLLLAGLADHGCPLAPAEAAWRLQTQAAVNARQLPGGHLFIIEDPAAALAVVCEQLAVQDRTPPLRHPTNVSEWS